MSEHERMNLNDNDPLRTDIDDEILIGRLVDHEASGEDQDRFERAADMRPDLWRALALRQRDMMILAGQVEIATAGAERIELPDGKDAAGLILPRRLTWTLALSGWAAVLIVALTWATIVMVGGARNGGVGEVSGQGDTVVPAQSLETADPAKLLDQYMANAPWNVREQDPSVQTFELNAEGGYLWIMRRFDEELYLGPVEAQKLLQLQAEGVKLPYDPIELLKLLGLPAVRPEQPGERPN